jgi:NADH dehydrogenase (ubiquinone) 1 alpha subcomplex subunit 13
MLAEQDRDIYRRNVAQLAREKEIMKDVPGWEVSPGDRASEAKRESEVRGERATERSERVK